MLALRLLLPLRDQDWFDEPRHRNSNGTALKVLLAGHVVTTGRNNRILAGEGDRIRAEIAAVRGLKRFALGVANRVRANAPPAFRFCAGARLNAADLDDIFRWWRCY